MPRGVYVINYAPATVSAAQTLIQLKAGSAVAVRLLRAAVSQSGSTTSTELPVEILRKSAAETVTSFTPLLTSPNDAAANSVGGASATGIIASTEANDSDIMVRRVWNILTPFEWVPTPLEQVEIAPSGIIGLKLPTIGASYTIEAQLVFQEIP